MKFRSGAKLRKFKFTARSRATSVMMTAGGPVETAVKPLRAIFNHGDEHTFDSLIAQEENEWTDEERIYVEKKLLNPRYGYFGKRDGRGIWLIEDTSTAVNVPVDAPKCKAVRESDGEPCENPAVEGGLYCEDHILEAIAEGSTASGAVDEPVST